MYESLLIKNFRCFPKISFDNLQRVNLIAGDNNVGKSAVLEALWLLRTPNQPELARNLSAIRGQKLLDPEDLLSDLFHGFDTSRPACISAKGTWGADRRILTITRQEHATATILADQNGQSGTRDRARNYLTVQSPLEIVFDYTDENGDLHTSRGHWLQFQGTLPQMGMFGGAQVLQEGIQAQRDTSVNLPNSVYLPPSSLRELAQEDVTLYSRLEVKGKSDFVLQALRQIDGRIERITAAVIQSPMLHVNIGNDRLVSVAMLGNGASRFLSMILQFHVAQDGMMLIDEVENGVHYTKLASVWQQIRALADRFNVQVFATTQSRECLAAAHQAFQSPGNTGIASTWNKAGRSPRHTGTTESNTLSTRDSRSDDKRQSARFAASRHGSFDAHSRRRRR